MYKGDFKNYFNNIAAFFRNRIIKRVLFSYLTLLFKEIHVLLALRLLTFSTYQRYVFLSSFWSLHLREKWSSTTYLFYFVWMVLSLCQCLRACACMCAMHVSKCTCVHVTRLGHMFPHPNVLLLIFQKA